MMKNETLTQALQRIMEQVDGQTNLATFDSYEQLDSYFKICAQKAASFACSTSIKHVSTDVTAGFAGYEEVSWQVRINYQANLFGGNLLAYQGEANHETYMKFIKDFADKLNEALQVMFPEVKVACQTSAGGRKFPGTKFYEFTFYCKAKVRARLPEAAAA